MSIRIPANILSVNHFTRRSAVKGAAGASLGLGGISTVASAFAQDSTPDAHEEHGEGYAGSTGDSGDHVRYDPYLAPVEPGDKEVLIDCVDKTIWINNNTQYEAWTFNGTVPGPPIRAVQGDKIKVTVTNSGSITHNVDFHSARVDPDRGYELVPPGEEFVWEFVAEHPGAYMVHCGTGPVVVHIGAGMYLPMVVDPAEGGFEPATEIILSQSEFYTMPGPDGDVHVTDADRLFEGTLRPNVVAFNGHGNQYVNEPIEIPVGELVRIYVVNHGPNVWSAFHVVGAIFDAGYFNANPKNKIESLQTMSVGPGDGIAVEFKVDEPGDYIAVNHAFGYATIGAIALLRAVEK